MNAVRDDCPGSTVAADPLASLRVDATAIAELAFGSFSHAAVSDGASGRHLAFLSLEALELDLSDPLQRQVGDYDLIEKIGEGGMGVVYRAHQRSLDRDVAVKLLAAGPWASKEFIERFRKEAQNAARMQHPNIVAIYEVGSAEELHFFSMRMIRGGSLAGLLRAQGKLDPKHAAQLLRTIAEAVDYAHKLGVLHLDLKPANVLLDDNGNPHVADFGLARRLEQGLAADNNEISGTPSYMAPEQCTAGAQKIMPATDIWGLGAILYELVTGEPPFVGVTPQETLKLVVEGEVRSPRRYGVDLPRDLEAIITKCLAHDVRARYASARELADDLGRFLTGYQVKARPLNTPQRAWRWARREPKLAAATLLAFGALAIGLLATTQQWRRAEANAGRAEATKNFIVSLFEASDPRVATDKPRGQITAKELLDLGSARVEKEFAAQPETQIDLLGTIGEIYLELGDNDRYAAVRSRHLELARRQYGESHPIVIKALLQDADHASRSDNARQTLELLDQVDPLLHRAGLDASAARAYWWSIRGTALLFTPQRLDECESALQHAVDLYARVAPGDPNYTATLNVLGNLYGRMRGDLVRYRELLVRIRALLDQSPGNHEPDLARNELNLAWTSAEEGDYPAAMAGYRRAGDLYRRTYGEHDRRSWTNLGFWAESACDAGDRAEANRLFDELRRVLPAAPSEEEGIWYGIARENYGTCLAQQGRLPEAVAELEAVSEVYARIGTAGAGAARNRLRLALGDAYDRLGRHDDARQMLQTALQGHVKFWPADSPLVLPYRERWGRFLLSRGEAADAEAQFREVISQDHGRNLAYTALAYADLSLLALGHGDAGAALAASTQALRVFDTATGYRNVRMQPSLWRIHAQALARAGNFADAQAFAQRALQAFQRYDDPASAEIAASADLVADLSNPAAGAAP